MATTSSKRFIPKSLPKPVVDDSRVNSVQANSESSFVNSALPKHIPFPYIDGQSDWLTEGFTFLVGVFALGCQYLEMYRTVWWLPEFANKQALHFQLIDKIVLTFILAILARKFLALFVLAGVKYLKKRHRSYHQLANYVPHVYILQLACLLGVCCFDVFLNYGILSLFCLCYP